MSGDMTGGPHCEDPDDDRLIHLVSCNTYSEPRGTDGFELVEAKAKKLMAYAHRLGFTTGYENDQRICDF